MLSEVELDIHLFKEIFASNISHRFVDLCVCLDYLEVVEQMLYSPYSEIQILMLQNLMVTILQSSAFRIHNMQFPTSDCNRDRYASDRMLRNMLNLAARFGCPTDLLYIAMYYYQTSRYREALSVVEMTKESIAHRHGRCLCPAHQMLYRNGFGGQSWTFKMKHTVWKDILLDNFNTYLDELRLEQHSILQSENESCAIVITPYVLTHMVEFICCKQTDSNRAKTILAALQSTFQNVEYAGKLSWQILGICQQMAGNHLAALHSYLQSLQQASGPNIESATLLRIQDLHMS